LLSRPFQNNSKVVETLAFIAKLFHATTRVGAAVAIAALVVYLGRRAGINFFVDLNENIFQTLVVAGIVGGAMVAVELVLAFGRFLRWIGSNIETSIRKYVQHKRVKRNALKKHEKPDARVRSGIALCSIQRLAAVYSQSRQPAVMADGERKSSQD
jgi:hypothetical protein